MVKNTNTKTPRSSSTYGNARTYNNAPTDGLTNPPRNTSTLSIASVQDICKKSGFSLSLPEANSLTDYLEILQKWNKAMNLVGKTKWQDILQSLVMDSLHLARFLEKSNIWKTSPVPYSVQDNDEIWDLGAGAGLPGIPLRIFWEHGTYHLVESREKKSMFLNTALTRLKLPNTHVFAGRAENFMKNKKARLIITRAFMPWQELLPFVENHLLADTNTNIQTGMQTDIQTENTIESPEKAELQNTNGTLGTAGSRIIFLTLENLPQNITIANSSWLLEESYSYHIHGKKRYLCALKKNS